MVRTLHKLKIQYFIARFWVALSTTAPS